MGCLRTVRPRGRNARNARGTSACPATSASAAIQNRTSAAAITERRGTAARSPAPEEGREERPARREHRHPGCQEHGGAPDERRAERELQNEGPQAVERTHAEEAAEGHLHRARQP